MDNWKAVIQENMTSIRSWVPGVDLRNSSINYKFAIPACGALAFSSVMFYKFVTDRRPPGPYGLPFLGYNIFPLTKDVCQTIGEWSKYYNSEVVSITVFGMTMVFLNTYDVIKDVLQKRTDAADRPDLQIFRIFDPEYTGIAGTSGKYWKDQRRFTLSMMKNFGMGRTRGETLIQEETELLLQCFGKNKGEAFEPKAGLNMAVSNIICGIVFGHRFDYDDPEFQQALDGVNELAVELDDLRLFLIYLCPPLKHIFRGTYQSSKAHFEVFTDFVKKQIKKHEESYDGTVTDLVFGFLKEIEDKRDPEIFNTKGLECLISDLFFAGSETTYSTLRWCLLFMAAYPEIQNKVYNELNQSIGDGPVSMADKLSTPYTEAVLNEVQRFRTLLPLGPGHCNLQEDIEIGNYVIPKGALISPNLHYVHRDPKVFKSPNDFDPENFYKDGKVINQDRLIQFAIGRRSCTGESLAIMALYIFFVSILRKFELKLETDSTVPDLEPIEGGGVFQATPYKLRMIERK